MTPDTPDDDRTVIRPLGGAAGASSGLAGFGSAAPAGTRPPNPTLAPVADERTLMPGEAAPLPAHADIGNGLPVGTRLAEFELTQYIAEGGFGIVYMAYDHSLQRRVALKEYMPSSLAARAAGSLVSVKSERHRETFEAGRKSFVNEARLLASFDHPSLLKVYRFWEANGTAYMVMPFLEGTTLKDRLRELGRPPDEAWLRDMLGPLTEALVVIHREQCFHRDIAPDNVMLLAGRTRALLMDFGASRRVIGDMTQALTVILKPGYAPVEQYAEIPGMKQGAWTDVYALAAVVYYAIIGKTPPPSVGRLLNDTYVPLAQAAAGRYSPGFLAAIDQALRVKPNERTPSIEHLRAALGLGAEAPAVAGAARGGGGGGGGGGIAGGGTRAASASAAPAGSTEQAGGSKTPLMVGGGVVAALVLALGAYFLLSPGSRPAPSTVASVPAANPPAGALPVPVSPTPATAPNGAAQVPVSGPATAPLTAPTAAPTVAPAAVTVAAPPPAAAPAAPAAPTGFDVGTEFDHITQAQTAGFTVQAKANKAQLRIGRDELSFTVQSERDGFLYVQGYSSDGSLLLLYPNATVGTQKVRKGQTLKLPQSPIIFETTEPAGPTLLLVLVSARERDFSVLQPRKEGTYRLLPTGADAQRIAAAQPPSRVPLQAGRVICPGNTACDDEYGAAVIRIETVR